MRKRWRRAFIGQWHQEENRTLQASVSCTQTQANTQYTHTPQPEWLSVIPEKTQCCFLWFPESNLYVITGKYPQWPHILNRSRGKSPCPFLESMGFIWCSNKMCMACKLLRKHLHLTPLHVWKRCIYSDFCYYCVCKSVCLCMCVCTVCVDTGQQPKGRKMQFLLEKYINIPLDTTWEYSACSWLELYVKFFFFGQSRIRIFDQKTTPPMIWW